LKYWIETKYGITEGWDNFIIYVYIFFLQVKEFYEQRANVAYISTLILLHTGPSRY